MTKKSMLLVICCMAIFVLFVSGCIDFIDFHVEVDPDTLNLNNRGRGVMTAYVVGVGASIDDVSDVKVGYDDEWATSTMHSVEEIDGVETLIVKVDRAEMISLLKDAGVAEDVFEEFVNLDVLVTFNGDTFSGSYSLRVINPANAGN